MLYYVSQADVAQWQSGTFVKCMLEVRFLSSAPLLDHYFRNIKHVNAISVSISFISVMTPFTLSDMCQ